MKKYLTKAKNQKGAVSVLVTITVITFVAILLGSYLTITALRKSQIRSDIRIQEIYGKDVNNVDEIYADLTGGQYTITYNLDGGTVAIANPTTYTKDTETFTLNNPTKEGYFFVGWTGSNGDTPATTVTIEIGSRGKKSYTANWATDFEFNYTQIQYIQGSGTQWIDTGYMTNSNLKVETQFMVLEKSSSCKWDKIYGTKQPDYYYLQIDLPDSQYFLTGYYRNNTENRIKSLNPFSYNTIYTVVQDKNTFYLDGVLQGTCKEATFNCTSNLAIFNSRTSNGGNTGQIAIARLYYFKIYDNGTLVRDFVPCKRNSDSKPGLYDKVNGVFYTNAGTGEFIIPS